MRFFYGECDNNHNRGFHNYKRSVNFKKITPNSPQKNYLQNLDFHYSSVYRDCSSGYVKNEQTGQCDDIDECEGSDVKCNMETQVCYNLPGAYQCLDILPAPTARVCPHGFKFDDKIKQCTG